ncbi:MAG: hypothetical protein IJL08_05110 [Oscillospiraceae bacterium]|nr:hypothetical protein [Oscillospiraceae bacterium]
MSAPSKARKRAAPLVWALVFIVLFAAVIGLILWGNTVDPAPTWFVVIWVAVFGGLIIGVTAALIQRLREIEKGEEDEAAQY